jgi:hypothetical protein
MAYQGFGSGMMTNDTERLSGLASGDATSMSMGGKYSPSRVRRATLLRDSQRLASGQLGMSTAEKRQSMDETGQQIGAALEAQSQDLGQMALAAGPRDAGRLAMLQREIGQKGIATGMAQASAETERLSQQKAMAEKQSIEAALERQQQLDWQKEQYYGQMAKEGLGGLAENAEQVGGLLKLAGAFFTGGAA